MTLYHTTLEDDTYDELWQKIDGQTFQVGYQNLYLGPEGIALAATLPEELRPYYMGSDESAPHVTLAVSKHHTAKQLGPMVKLASNLQYNATEVENTYYNQQHQMFRIILPQGSEDNTRTAKQSRRRLHENHPDTEIYLSQIPPNIWMMHPNDVGQTKHVVKITLTTDKPIYCPQYPLKEDEIKGIQETIDGFLESGVIYETESDYNTPLFPVKKSDWKNWKMVQDYRKLNEVTAGESYPVPDPCIALNNLSPDHKYYTVIDLANAFFTINLHPDSQKYFAFRHGGKVFSYRRKTAKDVLEATVQLLTHLSKKGYKVKKKKLQVARQTLHFLGREVSNGAQGVSDSNKDAILSTPKPVTVRQMLSFLGLCNCSREYVSAYTELTAPLRELIKPHGMHNLSAELSWTPEAEESFIKTKRAICTACNLCAPNYNLQFHLDVDEKQFFVQSVLYQKHQQNRRVLKHYSCKLDPHEQTQPGCSRYLAALTRTIDKTAHIVQNHPLVVHTHHGILAYLNSNLLITTAQRSSNISKTLRQPHLTYEGGTINMAANMETEGTPHVCKEKVKTELYIRADLQTTPIPDAEMTVLCDGCSYRAKEGHVISSYAIVEQLPSSQHRVLEAQQIEKGSAQVAELTAMLRALQLSAGKSVNIYTDSVYAYKTVTLSLAGWIRNGFKLMTGLPIKHEELIRQMIDAVKMPKRIAVMKCKAHTKMKDSVSLGNQAADEAAKQAANYDIRNMQKEMWKTRWR